MSPSFQRNKGWIRIAAIILIVTFINQDLVWAQDGASVLSKGQAGSFSLPKDLATAKDVHVAKSGKTIINIQDAHASIGAQDSIVSVLDSLVANYDLKLIAIEGSSGYIDTSLLKTFPDKTIRDRTANDLMRKGRMSAAELFSVTRDKDVALYGIEDSALYKENVEQFRRIYDIKDAVGGDITKLRSALDILRRRIYPKELKSLEDNAARHMAGEITFATRWEFALKLAQTAGLDYKKYANLSKLADSLKLEIGIDFEKANKERDRLIDSLTKKLSKPELEELVLKSLSYKTGKISRGEYYAYLEELAQRCNVEPALYKELAAYTRYITAYESIDIFDIFEEVAEFEEALKEKLFTDEDQRLLYRFSKCAGFINDLFNIRLTGGEFDYLVKNLEECNAENFERFIKSTSLKYKIILDCNYDIGKIFENIPAALEFYKTAEKRNSTILDNTIKRMDEEGKSVAALITGGYHTTGITRLIKEKQASYLVILPKFDTSKGDRPYVTILTNKKEPYEPLLKSGRYYLATAAYFEGMSELFRTQGLSQKDLRKRYAEIARRYGEVFTREVMMSVTKEDDEDRAQVKFASMAKTDSAELWNQCARLIGRWSANYRLFYKAAPNKEILLSAREIRIFMKFLVKREMGIPAYLDENMWGAAVTTRAGNVVEAQGALEAVAKAKDAVPPHAFKPLSGWSLFGLGGGVDWVAIFGSITGYIAYYMAANWSSLTSIGMVAMPILAIITLIFTVTSFVRVRDCVRATRIARPDFTFWQSLRNDIGHDDKALTVLKNNYRYTYLQIFCHETFDTHVLGLLAFLPRSTTIKSVFNKQTNVKAPPHAFRILGFGGVDWVLIAGALTAYSLRYFLLNIRNLSYTEFMVLPALITLTLIFTVTSLIRVLASFKAIYMAHPEFTLWQILTHNIGHDNMVLSLLKDISPYTYNQILFHETFKFHTAGLATFIPGVKAPVLVRFEDMVEKLVNRGRMPVIVSDLDGTLMEANLPITNEMADAIIEILKGGSTFALLSGISKSRIERQFIRPLLARLGEGDREILNNLIIGSDNGTQIYRYDRAMNDFKCIYAVDIREHMSVGKYNEIFHLIYSCIDKCNMRGMLKDTMGWEYTDEQWEKFKKECVVKRKVGDKVTQITFMVAGYEATHQQKEQFQGKRGDDIRGRYQKFIEGEFKKNGIELDVKVSGLSSIDITLPGIDKGFGIKTISKLFSIPLNCIIFFGDSFAPGQNDEPATKIVNMVVNVGSRVDITRSLYYRKTVRFLQMVGGGPRGSRLFAEAFARQIRRLAPASRTSVYADAMTSEEALDIFNSPDLGKDNTGAILFKMGLPEVLRRAIIERLHKSGISTYRFARLDNAVGFNAVMKLWSDGIVKSLDDMEKAGLDVAEGRRAFAAKEDAQFTDWVYRLYNEVVVDNREKYSEEAFKAIQVVVYSLDCLNRSVEVVLVKSRVPRSDLVRAYAEDEETANSFLKEKLGDDAATYENCAFQDFLKHIIVGATNVNKAHQFSLRGGIIKPDLTPEGSLKEFVHSARHFNVPDGMVSNIANGIHCAGFQSLKEEKDVYRVIESMSDATRSGMSEASQISVPGLEIDHDSVISIGEVTRSGFLKDIVEKRYTEIETSLGIRGRSVLPVAYCKSGGTIKQERIKLHEIPEKNIPEGIEVNLLQTPWRVIYRQKIYSDVSYSVDQPHGPAANEKACSFCHLPKEEILFNVIINGSEYMVAVNIRPFGDKHLMLISKDPLPQDMSKRVEDVLLFVNAMGPEYEAAFNSPGAAASKLHFHVQVFKTRSPLRDNMANGLVTRSGTIKENGIRKSMLLGWFGDVKELVGNNPFRLAVESQKDIDILKKRGIPYSSVIFVKRNGAFSVFTIPRESEAPPETLEFDAEGATRFGANDIAGNVVVNSPAVRDAIIGNPQTLADALYAATKRGVLSVIAAPESVSLETAAEKINALKDILKEYVEFTGNIPTHLTSKGRKERLGKDALAHLTKALDDDSKDVRYFTARCILIVSHLPSERARVAALSVWLQHVVDLADSLFATEDYEEAVVNYDVFLTSAWVRSVMKADDMNPLSISALNVILNIVSERRALANRRALECINKAASSKGASGIIVGIPKSSASPGLAKMIRDMADAEFPKLRIAICQMNTDSPDELLEVAQARGVGQGVVLDLPEGPSLSAARSYLEGVERERFKKESPDIVILNGKNIGELSKNELEAKVRAIEESLPAVSATSIEELKTMLVARSRDISESFVHANSRQLNSFLVRKARAVSVTTQGVLESQMMYALRDKIKARWEIMGVKNKEEDPVKEIVAITSAGMNDEAARKYVDLQGLEGYVEIRMARTEDEKALLSRELFGLKQEFKHVGIRSTKSEDFDHMSVLDLTMLELGSIDGAFIDTNSYEALFELFARPGEWNLIPGISKDETRKIFIYIPRSVPFNYEREIRQQQEALRVLLQAA